MRKASDIAIIAVAWVLLVAVLRYPQLQFAGLAFCGVFLVRNKYSRKQHVRSGTDTR